MLMHTMRHYTLYKCSVLLIICILVHLACDNHQSELDPPTNLVATSIDESLDMNQMIDLDSVTHSTHIEDILSITWPKIQYPSATLRRLTRLQFKNSVQDLLGADIIIPSLSEPDLAINGLFNVGSSISTYSSHGVENVANVTLAIGKQAIESSHWTYTWNACFDQSSTEITCLKSWLKDLILQAWRRPLQQSELERLLTIIRQGNQVLEHTQEILPYVISAILQSPHFLYRYEQSIPKQESNDLMNTLDRSTATSIEDQPVYNEALTPLSLVTRLSYFLFNTTPSQALLQKAIDGKLNTLAAFKLEAETMLENPQTRKGILNFFNEYLKLYALDHVRKDPNIFEHYYPELGQDAREETLKLIEFIVFDLNQDFRNILNSKESFINARLAALYKIPSPHRDDFAWVNFAETSPRGGILTHSSFLALNSHTIDSSATLRGKAIRTLLLCQSIPEPPVDVDTSIPEPSGNARTLRDRVSEHLENASCAGCHSLMDPLGLALENFDAIGRWRDQEHDTLIDARGELDGIPFEGAIALGEVLAQHPEFGKCLVKKLMRYAIGRLETEQEEPIINILYERLRTHQFKIKPWLIDLIMSPIFRYVGTAHTLDSMEQANPTMAGDFP
jgi:hypothetical protein